MLQMESASCKSLEQGLVQGLAKKGLTSARLIRGLGIEQGHALHGCMRARYPGLTISYDFLTMQPEAAKKYEQPPRIIPSVHIQHKKVSSEACKAISLGEQTALQTSVPKPRTLTVEALEQHDQKETSGPCELRQFACGDCQHWWWRMVLKTKPVSRCRGSGGCGSIRYDALPRDKEFGIGRCICPNTRCKRKFYAYCEATDELECRKCGTPSKPYIHPRWRKRRRGARLNAGAKPFRPRPNYRDRDLQPAQFRSQEGSMESLGPTFYPATQGGAVYFGGGGGIRSIEGSLAGLSLSEDETPPQPPPPQRQPRPRRKPRIFNASQPHESDGNTMTTFLTQVDFEKTGEEVALDYDSDDDDEKIGACNFECFDSDCEHEYVSLVRMKDMAPCYKCGRMNRPLSWAPPRDIRRETNNKHSCSRCGGSGNCPNLQQDNW